MNKRGAAMLMVLAIILVVVSLIEETLFETQTEYRSAVSEMDSLKAYYAAKAGMDINFLRIKNYQQIMKQMGDKLPPAYRPYMDLLWKMPFNWPQDSLNETAQPSFMKASYNTSIIPSASRLDLNDLASPIPSLRKWTAEVLYRLIYNHTQEDTALSEREFTEQDIRDIISNITDWVDPDSVMAGNPSLPETGSYINKPPPPNRSFISLSELIMVEGMTEDLYEQLKPFITIYGEKGLNINSAPTELLRALHSNFPRELAEEISAMTNSAERLFIFTKESFSNFLSSQGFNYLNEDLLENKKEPSYLVFDAPYNFQAKSTGSFKTDSFELTAFYLDKGSLNSRFNKLIQEDMKRAERETAGEGAVKNEDKKTPLKSSAAKSQHQPAIIYWKESS